jgi:hypothetical protein
VRQFGVYSRSRHGGSCREGVFVAFSLLRGRFINNNILRLAQVLNVLLNPAFIER